SVSANISTNSNEITDMGESGEIILNGGANIQFIQRVGESIGSFYGLKSDGLYTQEEIDAGKYYKYGTTIPNAGDIKYVPQRDLEYGESISLDQDRTIIGCDVPSFTYGLNINLQYKNFEFSMFGQGVAGTKVGFGSYGLHPFYHGFDNPREYHLQRWTVDNPNPNAAYPRLYQNGNAHATYNQLFSDFYLFDADYFRFKTLSLGYSVPSNLVNRWGLQTLKVFLTGENLFTIRADKKLKDFDPESASGIISALGIKSFAIGVNVSF
ncbi:MAG: SusC/RagA family TonB-linked outer membrane protein, partial [Bacteroidales bacterium]|nr:SusC/RagA family TonB-linked outer membrane protein [Bacteroidales bacterium]